MWKDLQEKWQIHVVLPPFEYKTAVIFQALIPILNAFQTSGGINLQIWIGESVLQTMEYHLYVFDELMLAFFIQHMLIKNFAFVAVSNSPSKMLINLDPA
jgi:hypothetical protein